MSAPGISAETVPSRRALEAIEAEGEPHRGYVSEAHGFMPPGPLAAALPASHAAWDEVAVQLPELWSSVATRRVIPQIPRLSAEPEDLPDSELWRASVVLSGLAYGFVRCDLRDLHRVAPVPVPENIARPWIRVAERMGRTAAHVAYDDLVTCNWHLRDADRPDPLRLENIELAVPQQANGAEQQFLGGNVEITAQLSPVVGATVRAQEAVVQDDRDGLVDALLIILDRLRHVSDVSLSKIDPNPHSGRFADPALWAKLVAPTGIPIVEGVPGVSGAGAAALQLIDAFLGRTHYETKLGGEARHARDWYAPNVRRFLDAIEEVSVRDYVGARDEPELSGLFQSVVQAYAGDRGYLGVHKRKVYGFIQSAFKVGRPSTASGITGGLSARTWRETFEALEDARRERFKELSTRPQIARLASREPAGGDAAGVQRVSLDVTAAGVVYRPGDRLAVLPTQPEALVQRTLQALRAHGDEPVPLSRRWTQSLRGESGGEGPAKLPLRDLLSAARLRPLSREAGKKLADLSGSEALFAILEARAEDQYELWDAIELAAAAGYDPRRLWRAPLWEDESLSLIVEPAVRRMYSISGSPDRLPFPTTLALTVGPLAFRSPAPGTDEPVLRRGTGSAFLAADVPPGGSVDVEVVRPVRFRLPDDPAAPVVMFGGGTGIAPFLGFLEDRLAGDGAGPCWLFVGARTVRELPYRERLEKLVADGRAHVRVAISREEHDGAPARRIDAAMVEPSTAASLRELLGSEAGGATFYICGQAAFANTVIDTLAALAGEGEEGLGAVRRLVGEGRLMTDLFTTFAPASAPGVRGSELYDVSDLVTHNDAEHGWWLAINGNVYDVTEFRHLHPGGFRIIDDNAGLDTTEEYRAVGHHEDSEIEAMLAMYKIGSMRRYDLGTSWGVALRGTGIRFISLEDFFTSWVRQLYLVVEMENGLRNDLAFLQSALTRGDRPDSLTPLKLMLAADAQTRILDTYLPDTTGTVVTELWETTCGLFDPYADSRALPRRLRALAEGRMGVACRAGTERFRAGVAAGTLVPGEQAALLSDLIAVDTRLLADVKQHLRDGVREFEIHQADLLENGGPALLNALTGIGAELQAFYEQLAAVWDRYGFTTRQRG